MLTIGGTQIAGAGELARQLNVDRSTIRRWSETDGFPPCLGEVAGIPVWDADAVKRWHAERDQPRQTLIAHYLQHGSHIQAARAANISPRTAKKWLLESGAMTELDLDGM